MFLGLVACHLRSRVLLSSATPGPPGDRAELPLQAKDVHGRVLLGGPPVKLVTLTATGLLGPSLQ